MTKGLCRTGTCSQALSGEQVDLYPGPGEFCPECGERLEPVEQPGPFASALAQRRAAASGKAKMGAPVAAPATPPAEAAAQAPGAPLTETPDAPPADAPLVLKARNGTGALPAAALAFAGAALLFIMGALFLLRPSSSSSPKEAAVRVCATSITQRLAADIVSAYAAKSGVAPSTFDIADANGNQLPCEVRFMARSLKKPEWTLGHDAIVAVVNPQNPLSRITLEQVHGIFAGTINDWSQLGERPGAILPKLPDDASDEAQLLATTLLSGVKLGAGVQRFPLSGDVVRAVVSAGGRGSIGLVAFSQAVPAKVLALGASPVPSTLTIADDTYPLSLAVMVTSDENTPTPRAAGLIKYARSAAVQSIVVHSGLVAKEGL